MDTNFIIAQIFGAAGIMAFIMLYQFNSMKKVLKTKMVMDVLWAKRAIIIRAQYSAVKSTTAEKWVSSCTGSRSITTTYRKCMMILNVRAVTNGENRQVFRLCFIRHIQFRCCFRRGQNGTCGYGLFTEGIKGAVS